MYLNHLSKQELKDLKSYLNLLSASYPNVYKHVKRVGFTAGRTAFKLHKDVKAAFLGGIYHDLWIPPDNITGTIITVSDYIDNYVCYTPLYHLQSTLQDILIQKFPDDWLVIDTAMTIRLGKI